jgi:hypothetical protein
MRIKLLVSQILTVIFLFAAFSAAAQVSAPYQGKGLPIKIGFGAAGFEPDWGHGRMYGGAIWMDWFPKNLPSFLNGLGIEAEARDISLDKHLEPQADPQHSGQANTKEDTAGGGVIYNLAQLHGFHPYVKFIASQGSVDFIASPNYSHDTRLVMAPGGGFECRIYRQVWARADYEYQRWTGTLLHNYLTPSGYTVGITYDLSHPMR